MHGIARSLLLALGNLFHPRMLWLMIWPVLAALALWGTAALVFWAQMVAWLAGLMQQWVLSSSVFLSWDLSSAAAFVAKLLILLFLVPLVQLTALLILGVAGMPAMVEHVSHRSYPQLERRRGGTFAGSLWNSLAALAGMIGLFAVSLPLWLFPPLWPLIPVAAMGWANQRILRYDALAEHGAAHEMNTVFRRRRGAMFVLGALLALIAYVPVVGFFAPPVFGLVFIHFCLAELAQLRSEPIEAGVAREVP
ncbi:MAG: EI24 domain-containing protein [Betaproteobacteria bacterium]|nr:EI24 domain-containing protein [Betaproteobacteria bacterium]